jgi:hypothetical protein
VGSAGRVSASRAAWGQVVELVALGAMALSLLAASVVVLLVDEPAFRRAVGSSAGAVAPPTPGPGPAERGRMLFQTVGCVGCHVGPGVPRGMTSQIGPNLTLLPSVAASRKPGVSAEGYVAESIRDPSAFLAPGYGSGSVEMPRFGLPEQDVQALVRFLLAPGEADTPRDPAASAASEPEDVPGGLPMQTAPPPRIEERRFDPAPVGSTYPTVWVGDDVTMSITFAEGSEPNGELSVRFLEDDGHGDMTVTVRAERIGPRSWRAHFALPRVGRWEGQEEMQGVQHGPPPFALRVVRPSG